MVVPSSCPVCRAEVTAPARRCFVETTCPVCLVSASSGFALPCGHIVCGDDLAALGLAAEQPPQQAGGLRLRLPAGALVALKPVAMQCLLATLAYYSMTDPGFPFEAAHSLVRLVRGGAGGLCAAPCYGTHERSDHLCLDDCACDGARHCSFFGFCAGSPGECSVEDQLGGWPGWALAASTVRCEGIDVHGPHPTRLEFAIKRHMLATEGVGPGRPRSLAPCGSDAETPSPAAGGVISLEWSPPFALGGVAGLSLRVRVGVGGNGSTPYAHVRLRGPEGYFAHVQVTYAGRYSARKALGYL
jgi:hypothetical protein